MKQLSSIILTMRSKHIQPVMPDIALFVTTISQLSIRVGVSLVNVQSSTTSVTPQYVRQVGKIVQEETLCSDLGAPYMSVAHSNGEQSLLMDLNVTRNVELGNHCGYKPICRSTISHQICEILYRSRYDSDGILVHVYRLIAYNNPVSKECIM